MAVNGYSVGKDVSLDLVTRSGPISLGFLTSFTAKADTVDWKSKGIDGETFPVSQPDTWSGSFDYDRTSGTLDNYFAAREEAYFAGNVDETLYITQTIVEPDGNLSQYRFDRVVLKYDDAGSWAGEGAVKQKVSYIAARRRKIL